MLNMRDLRLAWRSRATPEGAMSLRADLPQAFEADDAAERLRRA